MAGGGAVTPRDTLGGRVGGDGGNADPGLLDDAAPSGPVGDGGVRVRHHQVIVATTAITASDEATVVRREAIDQMGEWFHTRSDIPCACADVIPLHQISFDVDDVPRRPDE